MAAPRTIACCLSLLVASVVATQASLRGTVTPVEKVIELMQRLEAQIQKEGATEAAEYDKFACFCKSQVDSKTHSIEKSEAKILALGAKITALGAKITQLDDDVITLGNDVTGLEGDISGEEGIRQGEHADYLTADTNVTEAIAAVDDAIEALRESKGKMVGDAKLDLSQLSSKAGAPIAELVRSKLALTATSQNPHASEYSSNDIIATLIELRKSFKLNKDDLDKAEYTAATISDKKVLGWSNEKKFKEKAKLEKEALSAKLGEEKSGLEGDKQEEDDDMQADTKFRTELTTQCQDKATEWDQRSKSRAGELTAIAEATEILKGGVSEKYAVNKKLTGLATKNTVVVKPHSGSVAPAAAPAKKQQPQQKQQPQKPQVKQQQKQEKPQPHQQLKAAVVSLLQLGSVGSASSQAAQVALAQKAAAQLADAAQLLGSDELRAAAAKVGLQEDHFVKVRQLINDLIAKLEAEATEEMTQKTWCDTEMGTAIATRDTQALESETQEATMVGKEAAKAQLLDDIKDLSKEVAELNKAMMEATELRSAEKKANERTVEEAAAGKAAVQEAIAVLENYYGTSLVQASFTPENADREGKTVEDLAPKTSFSGDYDGQKDSSKGIIGLLNVILSDFERTESTVGGLESAAAGDFTTFETSTKGDIGSKQGLITTKEGEVETAKGEILSAQDAITTANRLHDTAVEELQKLSTMCVAGAESYAERKEQREKEIEALKGAMKILEEWKD